MALHDPVRVSLPDTMVVRLEPADGVPLRVGHLVAGVPRLWCDPFALYCVLPDELGGPLLVARTDSTDVDVWEQTRLWLERDRADRVRRALRHRIADLLETASAEEKTAARIPAEFEESGTERPAAIAERVNQTLARAEDLRDRANACREALITLNRSGLPPDEP